MLPLQPFDRLWISHCRQRPLANPLLSLCETQRDLSDTAKDPFEASNAVSEALWIKAGSAKDHVFKFARALVTADKPRQDVQLATQEGR